MGDRATRVVVRDLLVTIRDRLSGLEAPRNIRQSKSPFEIVTKQPLAERDAKWGAAMLDGEACTRIADHSR